MKRFVLILFLILGFSSCESEREASQEPVLVPTAKDSIQNYKGNFITAGDAAVLKGSKFIFQVKMDSTAIAIKDSLRNYSLNKESVIPVEVKGKVTNNPRASGYSQIIEIKEIVEIFAKRESDTDKQ